MNKVKVLADGQEVILRVQPGISAIVAPGEMEVVVPGYYVISPETTIETAKKLSQDEWVQLSETENFRKIWAELWREVPPPPVLAKGNLAVRHVVGMIMQLWMARCEGLKSHLVLPETYLHPAQCQRLMSMIYKVTGKPNERA